MNNLEEFFYSYRWQLTFLIVGLILIASGLLLSQTGYFHQPQVEIIPANSEVNEAELVVEVSGSVQYPGVYRLPVNSRVDDAIVKAGGMTSEADLEWVEKTLNRASRLVDGQKIYIPTQSEQTNFETAKNQGGYLGTSDQTIASDSKVVNINTSSQKELEALWGIGPVTAQNIIEQRPYSSVEELLVKKILKSNVYERNKNYLTIF